MKTILAIIALGMAMFTATVTRAAAPPLYEPFEYPAGANLIGQMSAQGNTWLRGGNNGTGLLQATVGGGNLTYPGLPASIGNSAFIQIGNGTNSRFPIGSTVVSGTIYYSFIFQPRDVAGLSTSGGFFAAFNNSGVQSTTLGSAGTRAVLRLVGNGFNVGLDKSSGGAINFQWYPNNASPATFSVNDTIFVVGCYNFVGPATSLESDDTSQLWVNPHPSTFGAATPPAGGLMATVGVNLSQVASFVLMQRDTFQPRQNVVDELRIGFSWAEVTPVGCRDLAAPEIFCPSDLTVEAEGPDGAEVTYSDPLAMDDCDPRPTVTCSPPSGDTFPIGTTTVTCTATDYSGRSNTCSFMVTVTRPPPPEVVFDSDLLPPADGMFIPAPGQMVMYDTAVGPVVLEEIVMRKFSPNLPPPKAGETSQTMYDALLEVVVNAGGQRARGTAVVKFVIRVTAEARIGGPYETEIVAMSIDWGDGTMLRESPTRQSTGQTTLRDVAIDESLWWLHSSFFDVFTELSVDGGQTWSPVKTPTRMELRRDPTTVPPVPAPTDLLPPRNDYYVMTGPMGQMGQIGFAIPGAGRMLLRDGRNHYFSQSMRPPPPGGSQTHQFSSMADMEVSMDGGMTWKYGHGQALEAVEIAHEGLKLDGGLWFETEMLQMNLSGVSPLGPFMIRESPTRRSMGGTAISQGSTESTSISSFFDIFIELSVDGGQTWIEADGPAHVELRCDAPEAPEPSPNLPPPNDQYVSPAEFHAIFEQTGVMIKDVKHERFTQSQPPPAPGQPPTTHSFGSQVSMMVSTDRGRFFNPLGPLPTACTVQMTFTQAEQMTRYYDTEMLQLDLQSTTPPRPFMIRESPTRASLGRTSVRQGSDGQFYISSFFDVFTELSVDGGQTWELASRPVRVVLTPRPLPCTIRCPADITVWTADSGGAVVSYPAPTANTNCGPVTISCTPPSGSKFPVGVTTVTCTDSGTPPVSCSFNVAVRLFTAPVVRFENDLLPPPAGMFATGPRQTTSYDNGLMIRNVVLRKFSESQPPPDADMPSKEVRFTAEVSLEYSMDGMKWDPAMGMADVLVQISLGGPDTFDTEILSMSLTGPGGLMIRESPTRQSTGITIKPPNNVPHPDAGSPYGAFFDVFTEVSLDGGMTWSPAQEASRVELRRDPTTVPVMDAPTDLLPPPNHAFRVRYEAPSPGPGLTIGLRFSVPGQSPIVIRNVRNVLFSESMHPPDPDKEQTQTFSSVMDMEVSMDDGMTYHPMRANARTVVLIAHQGRLLDSMDNPVSSFETEMLQMDISGGDLPLGVMLRESPTLRSVGGTIIGTNHISHIGSFFDIWTELSMDGGQRWTPADSLSHVELVTEAPEDPFPSPNLPPVEGQFVSSPEYRAVFQQGRVIINDIKNGAFTASQPPPKPGESQTHTFDSRVEFMISTDGGMSFMPGFANAHNVVHITLKPQVPVDVDTEFHDTELASMEISGGTLPENVRLRESPTRASLGRTSIRRAQAPVGTHHISSFFDVFVELSTDGGMTYEGSTTGPGTVVLERVCTVGIDCPPEQVVEATGPEGAVVNYPPPTPFGTCPPFTVRCDPPSGSTFPIGESGVTCRVVDSAGNGNLCIFRVLVRPRCTPPTITQHPSNVTARCGQNVTFSASATGTEPLSYEWCKDGAPIPGATSPTLTQANVQASDAGAYNVKVRNECGTATSDRAILKVDCITVEVDRFDYTLGKINLRHPDGQIERVILAGPSTVNVNFEGTREGDAMDDDGDGLDEVQTVMTELNLMGISSLGSVMVTLSPFLPMPGMGEIEEEVNATPGVLDLAPFGNNGCARSIFRLFVQIKVGDMVLCPKNAETGVFERLIIEARICHKPPLPGESYMNLVEQDIPLAQCAFDAEPSGFSITGEMHTPNVPKEIDSFSYSQGKIVLEYPNGQRERIIVAGPTEVQVCINDRPGTDHGLAADTDGDGLDQVPTVMSLLQLLGNSSQGPVNVVLDPSRPTTGQIEEKVNSTMGVLDLSPFGGGGAANSYFDVNPLIRVGTRTLRPAMPLRIEAMITHKPPAPGEAYMNLVTQGPIALLDENGNDTGIRIVSEMHTPNPRKEIDSFSYSQGKINLLLPDGTTERVIVAGPTTVEVCLEEPEGLAADTDADGLDEVPTTMTHLNLMGNSPMGAVMVSLDPALPTQGEIEEKVNGTPGVLDLAPFGNQGCANSHFKVAAVIKIGTRVFRPRVPLHIAAMICHKPPQPGEAYMNLVDQAPVELLDENGKETGLFITGEMHTPNPRKEIDYFSYSVGKINLQRGQPGGSPDPTSPIERVIVGGPTTVEVCIDDRDGIAADADADGLDEVPTHMTELNLMGSSSMGPMMVSLNPNSPTTGQIEEKVNGTPGVLDLAPFGNDGCANSYFDVHAIIKLGGREFCPRIPLHITAMICHKPPAPGEAYMNLVNQPPIELVDCATKQPTGIFIVGEMHTPNLRKEVDSFSYSQGKINLKYRDTTGTVRTERVIVAGPTTVEVCLEEPEGLAADLDGDGLDQVPTVMTVLNLMGSSSQGTVMVSLDPTRPTRGEIEEKVNGTPGVLDLAPFGNGGCANSYFDVNAIIKIGARVFRTASPLHIEAMICHKPPRPGESYMNLVEQEIELLDENGNPTGVFITGEMHTPNLPKEIDSFSYSQGKIVLEYPNGQRERIILGGPTTVEVCIDESTGFAADLDGDGLDDVPTVMTLLNLMGNSSQGAVMVSLDPNQPTRGGIEEKVNSTMGVLDLAPFGAGGAANSFFDVNALIKVGTRTLRPAMPLHMEAMITHKPPAPGEAYMNIFTGAGGGGAGMACEVPDNGSGTVTLPPPGCQYLSPTQVHMIIDGLPPGTTIELRAIHRDFICNRNPGGSSICSFPVDVDCAQNGGTLGGEQECASSTLHLMMEGTGMMAGYNRVLNLPVDFETHIGPRTPGQPVQSFDTDMFRLFGQITGDPDFDLLRIVAGTDFGLPSPGYTTLTRLPNGNWNVESFFDITYRIDFVGAAGGPFAGRSGSTTGTIRMQAGQPATPRPGIALLDENGNDTGIRIVEEMHTPNPRKEDDFFSYSQGKINIRHPNGQVERVIVAGPTRVLVCIDDSDGLAADTDADGLDEVPTEMTELNLMGNSSLGPVMVSLNPNRPTRGQIEEKVNGTSGVLDLAPFGNQGCANSFFEVNAVIKVGGRVLCPAEPLRIEAMICHKPPRPGEAYMNLVEQNIPLLDCASGQPTGFVITGEMHTPNPPKEDDFFSYSQGKINLQRGQPGGSPDPTAPIERVIVAGPTRVLVCIDEQTGIAADTDADGLDEVPTEMVELNLMGNSSMGPVMVSLNPNRPTTGQIEEKLNGTPGVLDLAPFGNDGCANSYFDVNAVIKVGNRRLCPRIPLHIEAMICHKPPGPGEAYMNLANQPPIELVDCETGQPTGIFIVGEMHTPNPRKEIDHFERSLAELTLCAPDGTEQTIIVTGPSTVEVCIDDNDGLAADTDGDGRDQVPTRMTRLDLSADTPQGRVEVRLRDPARHPNKASTGEIEEQSNSTPGVLDVPPFTTTGCADSFFDIYVEVRLPAGPGVLVLHNDDPKRMRAVICRKPPLPGTVYENPERIPLFDENENPSGYFLCRARHIPLPCTLSIRCPNNFSVNNDPTRCGADVYYPEPDVVGDCPPFNVSCMPAPGSFFPVGSTPVTCTARDAFGNTATCTFQVIVRDAEPPRVACPNDIAVGNDPNACGARVTYPSPTASDNCAVASITCAPASGSFFPVGSTIVTCTATDTSGNTGECKFTVTVRDTEAPIVRCPENIVAECQGPNGTPVTYSATATDNCNDPVAIAVNCNPPSGSAFPVGTTTVVCTATDPAGNVSRCTFSVTVRDTQAPTITCPNNIVAECQGPNGTPVTYAATATDRCDATPAVTCVPASGSLFPVGTTPVTCTATDDAGNTTSCTFTVTIRDSQPPVIACPSNMVVRTCLERERVLHRVQARDDCDGDVTINCQPPSGSAFPVGTTTVTCVATDDAGNKSECKFDVTVVQEPKPKLTITHLPNGGMQICWPYPSTGYRLQCTRELNMDPNAIQWLEVTNEPVVIGGMKCVTLPNQGPHRFYRLCCVSAPFVGNVSATTVREGDVITVTGAGFGNNPDNVCAMLVPAGGEGAGDVAEPDIVPLRVLDAQGDVLTARVGIISPRDAASGLPTGKRLMIGLGQGETGRPRLALSGIELVEPVWTWQKDGGADEGEQVIEPQHEQSPDRCFYSGPPSNGVLCVFLEGDWPSDATVCIVARAHDSKTDTGGYDLDGPTIRLLGQGTTLMCAEKLADVLRCAFLNQAGVIVEVQVTPMSDGRVKLTVSIPGGFIDRGILVICIKSP